MNNHLIEILCPPFEVGQKVRIKEDGGHGEVYRVIGINYEHRMVSGQGWNIHIATETDIDKGYGGTDGFGAGDLEMDINNEVNWTFQGRVLPWMLECFGEDVTMHKQERNERFCEEALEAVQAFGMPKADVLKLVDYVFDRPAGEQAQEVGGVMVTLAALCIANGVNMHSCGETELVRVKRPEIIEKIRQKNATKPRNSPLPGSIDA